MTKLKRATIKKYLDDTCREIIKLRDDYTCQRCGKKVEGQNCHWAHIISRGAGGFNLKWHLLDSLVLCFNCHIDKGHRGGGTIGWFKEKYPARWRLIQDERAKPTKHWTEDDLLELLNQRRQKLAEMKGGEE